MLPPLRFLNTDTEVAAALVSVIRGIPRFADAAALAAWAGEGRPADERAHFSKEFAPGAGAVLGVEGDRVQELLRVRPAWDVARDMGLVEVSDGQVRATPALSVWQSGDHEAVVRSWVVAVVKAVTERSPDCMIVLHELHTQDKQGEPVDTYRFQNDLEIVEIEDDEDDDVDESVETPDVYLIAATLEELGVAVTDDDTVELTPIGKLLTHVLFEVPPQE